jgi:EAL and modified HD-GYP domain-containing signal transduction protein
MLNRPPFITYSPLTNKKHVMLGAHLEVHSAEISETLIEQSLTALSPVWPEQPALILVEFVDKIRTVLPHGWQPPESAVILVSAAVDSAGIVPTIVMNDVPRRCLHVRDVAEIENQPAELLAVVNSALGELPRLVARTNTPVIVLDVNEPIDQARANNAGAVATGGWACLGWKRRPADKRVGLLSNVLKLLQLIEKDADTIDLEAILKRDALLSYKLISMANSAAFGLAVEVTSLRHAISILGRQKFRRWLLLLLVQAGGTDTPQVLLQVAFIRAAFLHALGGTLDLETQKEDLFLCGAFSLLDRILGISLTELLGRVSISEAITDALVGEEGPIAPLLTLMKAVEARDARFLSAQCELLAVSPDEVNRALLYAIRRTKDVSSL